MQAQHQRGIRPVAGSFPTLSANADAKKGRLSALRKPETATRDAVVASRHRSRSANPQRDSSTRPARAVRCASAPPLVASELLVNEKTFTTPTPPQAMAVSRHLVWISFADGGCEIRNARTAEVVKRFAGTSAAAYANHNSDPSGAATAAVAAGNIGAFGAGGSVFAAGRKSGAAAPPLDAVLVVKAMLSLVTRSGEPQVWLGLDNGVIEVHHGETAELLAMLKKHLGGVAALAEFGGLVYSGGKDQQVVQWRGEGCRYVRSFMGAMGHDGEILCMHAEGNALITGAADDTVKVWDVGTGDMQLTGYFHARAGGVTALCRVGQIMWSGDNKGQLMRWVMRTCEAVDMSTPHHGRITALKRAGSRVYSGAADGTLGVLCAETGVLLKRVEDQAAGWLTCIACPAELSRFVVWSADAAGRVQCWYQDEYTFMTRDHEQLNEEAWYRSGSTPYAEFRLSLAERNAQLREQLSFAEHRDGRTMAVLRRCSTVLGGGAAADVEAQYARLQDQMRMVEDRRVRVAQDLQKAKENAAQADRDLAATLALIRSTQNDLNALSAGYGDRLVASLPPVPSSTEAATATAPADAAGAAGTAAPPSLPNNPMLPPPPLTTAPATVPGAAAPAGGLASSLATISVAPMPPLGTASAVSAPPATAANNATTGLAGAPALPIPAVNGMSSVPSLLAGGAAAAPASAPLPLSGAAVGVGGPLGQPAPTATAVAPAPASGAAAVGVSTAPSQPLSHEQQVLALLASVERSKAAAAKEKAGEGVKWVNPNVGNYIQRRYYGAFPSLSAPEIEKREKRKGRMPLVKVVPLKRSASAAAVPKTQSEAK